MHGQSAPPLIGVTMGDPAGIGPEIVLKSAQASGPGSRLVVLGDLTVLAETAGRLGVPLRVVGWAVTQPYPADPGVLPVIPLSRLSAQQRVPGRPTPAGGEASYQYVETGIRLARDKAIQALVTAPISKAMWRAAKRDYPGHTELLASLTHSPDVRMMLVGSRLRVVLVTTHIPFIQVAAALSSRRIVTTLVLTARHLARFHGLSQPRLAVAGLNPHAGEGGVFGDEEDRLISPAVRQAGEQGLSVVGPLPADSVFVRAVNGEFDAVICLYHDQGLIPLKLLSWTDGVNVTIGLPIVRTSPDHGTAFDIAGCGTADPRSLQAALGLAGHMIGQTGAGETL